MKDGAIMKKNDRRRPARRKFAGRNSGRRIFTVISPEIGQIPVIAPKDFVEARKEIAKLVRESSTQIVAQLIELAAAGEVAPAKYLFEMVGLYPATEQTAAKPKDSLAQTLLQRMGLPPMPTDETEDHPRIGCSGLAGA
jgi:hypothetical protein